MLKHLIACLQPATDFEIIAGGTMLPIDFTKGTIVVTQITSETLTRADRYFSDIQDKAIIQSSVLKNTYQLDFYKINPQDLDYIEAHTEAEKIREILKSVDIGTYLNARGAEILPAFGAISFLTDFTERKELVNRAMFEIQLIVRRNIVQPVNIFDKINLQQNTIIGG